MAAAVLAAFLVMVPSLALANVRTDRLTNNYRVTYNLKRLKSADHDNALWRLARKRTYQIDDGHFAHRSDWQWFFNRLPQCAKGIGENIAYYSTGFEPYNWPFVAWRDSPDHRENMLGNWDWQASAIRADDDGHTYAVQLFLKGCRWRSTL
jgi:uncharacterized protein YkwD